MPVDSRAMLLLRVFLVGLFGILVVLQVLSLPGQFAYMAKESPDLAYLRWPLTAVTVLWVACVQVVIVCTWRLLSLVQAGRIFSTAAYAWVDGILYAIAAAWVALVAVLAFFLLTWDDPALPLLLILLVLGVAAAGLLVMVLRGLLRHATALQTSMEAGA